MQDYALCYHPDDRFSCAWAEIYTDFGDDHVILHTASAVWDQPMEVQQYRLNWSDNALCIPYETHSVLETTGTETPLRNLKATAFALDHVTHRNTHVIEQQFGLATRRMQAVEYPQFTYQLYSRGVARYQNG